MKVYPDHIEHTYYGYEDLPAKVDMHRLKRALRDSKRATAVAAGFRLKEKYLDDSSEQERLSIAPAGP